MQMAIKISPKDPKARSKALWARAAPVSPLFHTPVETITRAVRGQDYKSIDKYAHHGDDSLVRGMFHIRGGVGVGGGAHAGLIRKKASGNAVAHGFLYCDAQHAAGNGLGIKSAHENIMEGLSHAGAGQNQNDYAADNIQDSHQRHDLFCKAGDSLNASPGR